LIYQLFIFLVMLLLGGGAWFFLNYLASYMINVSVTQFPAYAGLPHVGFMVALVYWGILFLCFMPALIYLWVNTQRPEAR
jgi:hypothetical protein